MDAQDRDIRTVHGAAHVEAAGQRNAQLGREIFVRKVIVQSIHDALDDARGVGGGRMAVDPALRVYDVADGIVGPPHRESGRLQISLQRLNVGRIVQQELDIVAAGEAQETTAVLVCKIGKKPERLNTQQARGSGPNRINPLPRLGHVAEHAGSDRLVVLPLPIVSPDDRVKKLLKVRGADIGDSLHRLCCHFHDSSGFRRQFP